MTARNAQAKTLEQLRKENPGVEYTEEGEVIPRAKQAIFWKTPNNHDTDAESLRTGTVCPEPSLTQQQFKEDADINVIIDRFVKSGQPPPMTLPEHFVDLSGRTTYFEMASKIAKANESFYTLPAAKRAEFLNDPTRWADEVVHATNTGDLDKLRYLGIELPEDRIKDAIEADNKARQASNKPPTPSGSTPAPEPAEGPQKGPGEAPAGAKK